MTLAQADKFIRNQTVVKVVNDDGGIATLQFTHRDRSILYTVCGGAYHRDHIQLATEQS